MIKIHASSTNDVQIPMNVPISPTVPPISPPTFEGEDATPPRATPVRTDSIENSSLFIALKNYLDERLDQMERRIMEIFESNSCNCRKVRAREVGDQGHTFMLDEPMTREVGGQDIS